MAQMQGVALCQQKNVILKSRGRGNRTPVNGFGDRRTTAVLFP